MEDKYIPQQEDFDLFIEWPDQEGITQAGLEDNLEKLKMESQKAFNIVSGVIRSMAYRINKTINEINKEFRPDEIEIEFSIKLNLEAGSVIPMVAKTTTGGQFNIKYKWTLEKPKQASIIVNEHK